MKCILLDLHRSLTNRWFLVALLSTAITLYLSIGQATYGLLEYLKNYTLYTDSFWYSMSDLLTIGMKGEFSLLTLPALSALPFSAQALHEIKSGAIRPVVFRAGRKCWIIGKIMGCVISGMLLQGAAIGLLFLLLNGLMFSITGQWFPWQSDNGFLLAFACRMLSGSIWAGIGCVMALATETSSAAYLAPICLCYALMMIGTRFFPNIPMMNPIQWVSGTVWMPVILLIVVIALEALFLKRGVQKYA